MKTEKLTKTEILAQVYNQSPEMGGELSDREITERKSAEKNEYQSYLLSQITNKSPELDKG